MTKILPTPPRISKGVQKFCQIFLQLSGWKVEGEIPSISKAVVISAPHTSNWDFIYMLGMIGAFGLRVGWMAKDSLFRWPMGTLMRALGGFGIDRTKPQNTVRQITDELRRKDQILIGILPEGTRSKRKYWMSGFYYIAQAADVPVWLTKLDYKTRVATFGPVIDPSGDLQADAELLREFYAGVQGKYPENFSDLRFKPRRS